MHVQCNLRCIYQRKCCLKEWQGKSLKETKSTLQINKQNTNKINQTKRKKGEKGIRSENKFDHQSGLSHNILASQVIIRKVK